jgi:predicted phosphodiesterase
MFASVVLALSLAAPAAAPFEVAPYLHVRPGQGLHLGWTRAAPGGGPEVATFRTAAGAVVKVTAALTEGVNLVKVPWSCDLPEGASYQVHGMAAPVDLGRWPCRDDARVRLGFITDTQQDIEVAQKASALLATQQLDALIHGGDIVNWGGSDDQWKELLGALAPTSASAPLVIAAGNHDFFWDTAGDHLGQWFGVKPPKSWYRTRIGPVQLIVLDSNHAVENWGSQQQAFLQDAMASNAPWKVVVFHHALFSEGIAHSPIAHALEVQRHDEMKALILDDLESLGVDLVLTGHTHLFERSRKSNIEYVVGGPAGGVMGMKGGDNPWSLRSDSVRSVSVLEADADQLVVRSVDLEGNALDTFRLEKPGAAIARRVGVGFSGHWPMRVEP